MIRHVLLLPVFVLSALFFGWKGYEAWKAPLPGAPAGSAAASAASAPASSSAAAPPRDPAADVASIVARPLFRPDRLPFREAAVSPPPRDYAGELSRFRVLGTLFLPEGERAIVTGPSAAGASQRYEVGPGDALPGFLVRRILQDAVLLEADGREFSLFLYAGGPPGGTRAAADGTPPAPAGEGAAAPPAPAARGGGFLPSAGAPAVLPAFRPPPAPARPGASGGAAAPTGPPIRFRSLYPRPSAPAPPAPGGNDTRRGTR